LRPLQNILSFGRKVRSRAVASPLLAVVLSAAGLMSLGINPTQDAIAQGGTRTLTIYHSHTREQETITYKRFGSYDSAGLQRLNWMLRDWRRDEPTRMDPLLFDILWEAYRSSGSSAPIHVVSGYRSPGTNAMLRRRSRGVAKNSQHTAGKAIDFHLADVSMSTVRDIGIRLQNGGVGYYPRANTPWVHLDTGGVRHWPKVTRDHLVRLFPDEKTVHIPRDGRPLAGFEAARSIIEARGGAVSSGYIQIAEGKVSGKSLFQILFGGGEGDDDDVAPTRGRGGRAVANARQRGSRGDQVAAIQNPTGESGNAMAFFNQPSTQAETAAARASIQPRPTRPTPLPEPARVEPPPAAKTPDPAPAAEQPRALERPTAVAALAPKPGDDKKATKDKDDDDYKAVTVALPLRRPAGLSAPTTSMIAVALPQPRPANLTTASLGSPPAAVAPAATSTAPVSPQAPVVAGLRGTNTPASQSAAPAPTRPATQAAASAPPASASLGFAPNQSPATASLPPQLAPRTPERKAMDQLMSQVTMASTPASTQPVRPELASRLGPQPVSGRFGTGQLDERKGFSGSAIRPMAQGAKPAN
jgi:uncharacterized protein YcbK (DUF882 family)